MTLYVAVEMCIFNINRTEITEVEAHGWRETAPGLLLVGRKLANGASISAPLPSACVPCLHRPKSEHVLQETQLTLPGLISVMVWSESQ